MHNLAVDRSSSPSPEGGRVREEPGPSEPVPGTPGNLHDRLARMEHLLDGISKPLRQLEARSEPAWRCVTRGEPRVAVTIAIVVAIALQVVLPNRLTLGGR